MDCTTSSALHKEPSNSQKATAHTPGPWKLETVRTSIGVCHQIGPLGSSTKLHSACLYDDCYSDRARDLQLLADAHLIAAAPELLEAAHLAANILFLLGPEVDKLGLNASNVPKILGAAISKAERGQ